MNPGMKMLAITSMNRKDGESRERDYRERDMRNRRDDGRLNDGWTAEANYRGGNRSEYEGRDYTRNEYNGSDMNYGGVEGRFRNRRGREHYDDGRYAPQRNVRNEYVDDNNGAGYYGGGGYSGRAPEQEGWRAQMNRIGFNANGQEFDNEYRMSADYPRMHEMERMGGSGRMSGHASGQMRRVDQSMATEWSRQMRNADGTTGPHWTMEQIKQVMAQRGISGEPLEYFLVFNMLYSDFSAVFRKHGVGDKIDFYADMAKAWLEDKDAVEDKLAAYYECVVKK